MQRTPHNGARARSIQASGLLLGLLATAVWCQPARASWWAQTPFDAATASTMQGVLESGPNRSCVWDGNTETVYPGAFVYRNNNPTEPHLYQSYTLYNNGPARCIVVQPVWTHQDCGNLEIGVSLYSDPNNPGNPTPFDPNDITANLRAHSWESQLGGSLDKNDYRHSAGYYYGTGFFAATKYLEDGMWTSFMAPAYATVQVVLDSKAQPGSTLTCPIDDATSKFKLQSSQLVDTPLTVSVNDTSAFEFNDGTAPYSAKLQFYVSLSQQINGTVTVHYQTGNGTASAGTDYVNTSGDVTFLPGETTKLVYVDIIGDATDETPPAGETMTLTLSNPTPGITLADAIATGTIYDDDDASGLCRITNFPDNGTLPNGKVGQAYGPEDLRGWSATFDPTMDYDWSLLSGTLPPGVGLTEASVEDMPGSGNYEIHGLLSGTPTQAGTYTFNVQLVCPVDDPDPGTPPPEIVDTQLTITIEDEKPPVFITLSDASIVEGHSGLKQVTLNIGLSQALDYDLPLEVVLFDASAMVGDPDYQQLLSIPQPTHVNPFTTQESFSLDINGDTKVEGNEVFQVQLRTPTDHSVVAEALVTIVNDDFPAAPVAIPSLSPWGLGLLTGLLGWFGIWRRRALTGQE